MTILTVSNLDKIPTIALTPTLAQTGRDITDDHATDMMEIALHEAAHLIAAISARGCIHYVQICQTLKPKRYPAGSVGSAQDLPAEDAFVTFAGVAQEWLIVTNNPSHEGSYDRSHADQLQGVEESREADINPLVVLRAAQKFVADCDSVITYAAVGLLCLMTTTGRLDGRRLRHFLNWLKPQVPPIAKYLKIDRLKTGVWHQDDLDAQRADWLQQVKQCRYDCQMA